MEGGAVTGGEVADRVDVDGVVPGKVDVDEVVAGRMEVGGIAAEGGGGGQVD